MGLHRVDKTPCGFSFVEYFSRDDCLTAAALLNGKTLERRVIKFEVDPGFEEDRQYGRGKSGGQVRDEIRKDYDFERGGTAPTLPMQAATSFEHAPQEMAGLAPPRLSQPTSTYGGPRRHHYDRSRDHEDRHDVRFNGGHRRQRSRDESRYNVGDRRGPPGVPTRQVDEFGRDIVDRNQE